MRIRAMPVFLMVVLATAACGGGGSTGTTTTGAQTTTAPATATTAPPEEECSDLTGQGPQVTIVTPENEFVPECVIVRADQGITFDNQDFSLHNFLVKKADIDIDLPAGEQTSLEAIGGALAPGTYEFLCKYHSPSMAGEITVVEA
ncbi:MAG: cupredoxin domain-containing protein [Actinobacteria bacterium]|nr:cupredoxin domain-containing protein [Actinomycetota bacterium]